LLLLLHARLHFHDLRDPVNESAYFTLQIDIDALFFTSDRFVSAFSPISLSCPSIRSLYRAHDSQLSGVERKGEEFKGMSRGRLTSPS
jgi:hypothetical protein